MKWVNRFCQKHRNFGVPNLMLYIVVGNAIVYLFSVLDTTNTLIQLLYFNPARIMAGELWRLFTFMLIPVDSGILWVALSLYFYHMIGTTLEAQWGTARFTIYYASGVLFTLVYGMLAYLLGGYNITVGAAYINLSMFFSYATLYPNNTVLLFFIIPIKIKWLALVNAAVFVLGIISARFPLNLLPVAAVCNYLVFCGSDLMANIRPLLTRHSRRTINFKRASRKVQRDRKNRNYTYKCSVCGKTDTDNPEVSFRFCSRCEGYHCFCEEHINNHLHFKE